VAGDMSVVKIVKNKRSLQMAKVLSKNNRSTEKKIRYLLVRNGIRGWVMHPAIFGRPDFFFPAKKIAVFVDGCFWHGCKKCGRLPKTRRSFWVKKIYGNRKRDLVVNRELKKAGIFILRIWEHEIRKNYSQKFLGELAKSGWQFKLRGRRDGK
jgi:DNA mismatch endonuclease (patch repair protein)